MNVIGIKVFVGFNLKRTSNTGVIVISLCGILLREGRKGGYRPYDKSSRNTLKNESQIEVEWWISSHQQVE